MKLDKILLIHGPNLNLLGMRETDVYGQDSQQELFQFIDSSFPEIEFIFFQSNHEGVIIDGTLNLPSTMQVHSSQLYAKNISTFISHMMKEGNLNIDLDDEIISGSMFTHQGKITHEPTQQAVDNL